MSSRTGVSAGAVDVILDERIEGEAGIISIGISGEEIEGIIHRTDIENDKSIIHTEIDEEGIEDIARIKGGIEGDININGRIIKVRFTEIATGPTGAIVVRATVLEIHS